MGQPYGWLPKATWVSQPSPRLNLIGESHLFLFPLDERPYRKKMVRKRFKPWLCHVLKRISIVVPQSFVQKGLLDHVHSQAIIITSVHSITQIQNSEDYFLFNIHGRHLYF
jgi:hypothetical protein